MLRQVVELLHSLVQVRGHSVGHGSRVFSEGGTRPCGPVLSGNILASGQLTVGQALLLLQVKVARHVNAAPSTFLLHSAELLFRLRVQLVPLVAISPTASLVLR